MSGNGGAKFGGSFGGAYGGSFGGMPAQPVAAPVQAAAPAAAGDLIKDTTTRDFVKDVLEESKKQPVLVDFWATVVRPLQAADSR